MMRLHLVCNMPHHVCSMMYGVHHCNYCTMPDPTITATRLSVHRHEHQLLTNVDQHQHSQRPTLTPPPPPPQPTTLNPPPTTTPCLCNKVSLSMPRVLPAAAGAPRGGSYAGPAACGDPANFSHFGDYNSTMLALSNLRYAVSLNKPFFIGMGMFKPHYPGTCRSSLLTCTTPRPSVHLRTRCFRPTPHSGHLITVLTQ